MSTYRYCVLGPAGRVDEVHGFECGSLEEAQLIARRVLLADPIWTGIELWRDGRRVHVEFTVKTTRAHQKAS